MKQLWYTCLFFALCVESVILIARDGILALMELVRRIPLPHWHRQTQRQGQ